MPGRTNEQSILTNLNATDFLAALRPTSGNDVAAGATDNLAQLATLAAFVFDNITVSQLNELLKREIAITVSNTGQVGNLPGRLPITGSVVDNGQFVLTCPAGYVWHTAVASGRNPTELRSVTVNGDGTRELDVSVFNHNGNLQTVSFNLMGTLREA